MNVLERPRFPFRTTTVSSNQLKRVAGGGQGDPHGTGDLVFHVMFWKPRPVQRDQLCTFGCGLQRNSRGGRPPAVLEQGDRRGWPLRETASAVQLALSACLVG